MKLGTRGGEHGCEKFWLSRWFKESIEGAWINEATVAEDINLFEVEGRSITS